MRTTPARIAAAGAASDDREASTGTSDTERPPPLTAPEPTSAVTPREPPSDPGESTTIGRPPDTSSFADVPRAAPVRPAAVARPALPPTVGAPHRAGTRTSGDGTAVGLAPLLAAPLPGVEVAAPRASVSIPTVGRVPADHRVSTRQIAAAIADRPLTRRCTSCGAFYPDDFLVCPRDATPLSAGDARGGDEHDPLVGSLIGETYQIVRAIGEGGMGRVYEARHLRLKERRFAVKCLHADLARHPEMAARFLREAETASSIKHENVVDVFDVHHLADGTPYLVGEFLEGEELADYVKTRGPLEARAAARVGRQVCHALSAAHARGIVHRDMKPENIFVLAASITAALRGESRTLHVKVLDFGISKSGGGDSHLTRTGVIMGTPSYMSPEQARGRAVDHRADIYSLGACLYYMITGRRPFDADDPTSTLSMVLTEEPPRPREIDQRIPEMLELIVQRAMAKDANDRYATMAELEKALATFLGQSPVAIPSGHGLHPLPSSGSPESERAPSRALDLAQAFMGGESLAPAAQSHQLARSARPTIVITSGALGAWLIGGTVAALAGLVRALHDGEVTLTESLLLVVGCLFAAATPIALYVLHLRRVIWPNSVKAVQLATDLRRVTVSVLVAYGALAITGRVVHTVLWRSSRGLASGFWDIALFALSVAVALSTGGLASLRRNLRRRRPTLD